MDTRVPKFIGKSKGIRIVKSIKTYYKATVIKPCGIGKERVIFSTNGFGTDILMQKTNFKFTPHTKINSMNQRPEWKM